MTNIVTALTFTVLATNWHLVSEISKEVEIVTRSTCLQYGTNTFLLSTEYTIGQGGLRDWKPQLFVTNAPNYTIPIWDGVTNMLLDLK